MANTWSAVEQQVISMYHEKGGQTRSNAIRKLQTLIAKGITAEQQLAGSVEGPLAEVKYDPKLVTVKASKPAKAPKAKKVAKSKPEPKAKAKRTGYDQAKVISLYEHGKTVAQIAEILKPISRVYVSRILFGTSYGDYKRNPGQLARIKARKANAGKEAK